MIYFVAFLIVYFLHVLLKLHWITTVVLMFFAVFLTPFHKKRYLSSKENQERFYQMSLYLDTILYAFVKEEKVEQALWDVAYTLPEGSLKVLVGNAAEHIQMTFDKVEVLEDALEMIEVEYPSKRVRDVHQFMTHVEYYGGEIETSIRLLLEDKFRWEQRVKKEIKRREKMLLDIILSVATSLLICGAILYLPIMNIDISKEPVVQVLSVVVILANDFIIMRAQKYLEANWLDIELTESEEYYMKKVEAFYSYDDVRERRRSLIWGGIGLLVSMLCFFYVNEWMVVITLLIALFLFNQHRVGKGLLKRTLEKEIKYAFPKWLLDLVLLLQSENVYVALEKSKAHAPGVLQKELHLLTNRLEMEPESSAPYHAFLQEFAIPEINSAMGILYALSIGNSSHVDKQISELVEKNLELLDLTESELLKNSASGMYVLFLLPVMVASIKLVVDMVFLMLHFIQIPAL